MLGQVESEVQHITGRDSKRTAVLSEPRLDGILDKLADQICRRGLRLPAIIALQAGEPLAFICGQLLWIGQPLLSVLLPPDRIRLAARLLEEPDALSALTRRLEAREL
jgi:hypothetical protein